MKSDDIFCKIIAEEIPSYKVYEDDDFFAFLEINPIKPGHTLLVTKEHYATIYDIPKKLFSSFMEKSREIAPAIKAATNCRRVGLAVVGLDIEHAHLHILPINAPGDTNFANQKPAEPDDLAKLAEKIKAEILK